MKKLLTMSAAFILATGFQVMAQQPSSKFYSVEDSKYSLQFSKIIIEDDIDVTLHESDEKSIHLEGRKEDISAIRWRIKDGVLYLSSRSGSLKDKVLVTVDVSGLKQIEINGASEVKSLGNLHSGPLDIYLNGSCYVNIKNAGKITLLNGEGIGLDIKKRSANVLVSSGGA